jgi:hypothetical protein
MISYLMVFLLLDVLRSDLLEVSVHVKLSL